MNRALTGCLIVAGAVAAVVVLGIWFWFVRELPVLDATFSVPSEVELGSTVALVVETTNPHDEPVTLDSIDIDNSFLAGFQVVSTDPEPTETRQVPLIDQCSWEFGKTVPPGESLAVTFELKPVAEGHYWGSVDVCNPNQDFTGLFADVVVKKAGTPPAESKEGEGRAAEPDPR
ncbi:MAG: hypothetical protein R6V58_15445 [Planctomycetota bacterium]